MMSTTALLFLIASSQFLLSVQGLNMRLKGDCNKMILNNGEVNIHDLPVGGCRRYDTLECLSDVPYRGRMEEAYWKYTDLDNFDVEYKVNDSSCGPESVCKAFGWHSTLGIYKNGSSYYGVVRLGRAKEKASKGLFTCHFEGDTGVDPVTVTINDYTTTPTEPATEDLPVSSYDSSYLIPTSTPTP